MKKKHVQREKPAGFIASVNYNLYTLAHYLESYATALRSASQKSTTIAE